MKQDKQTHQQEESFQFEAPPPNHAGNGLPTIKYLGQDLNLEVSGYSLREAYAIFLELKEKRLQVK